MNMKWIEGQLKVQVRTLESVDGSDDITKHEK